MHDIFPAIHAFVAEWEGGYVNHKHDPGGVTAYGVSLSCLKRLGYDVNGDGVVDVLDVQAVTPELATQLFRLHFWDGPKLGLLPPLVAATAYDGGVNMGPARAVQHVQRACNACQGGPLLKADGACGPATAARARQLCTSPETSLAVCRLMLDRREAFYQQLAAKEPYLAANGKTIDYRPFLKGWLNRTAALWDWLKARAAEGWA